MLFEPSSDLRVRLIGDYTKRDEKCCGATYVSNSVNPYIGNLNNPANPLQQPGANPGRTNDSGNNIVNVLTALGQNPALLNAGWSRELSVSPGRSYGGRTEDYGGSMQIDWSFGDTTLTSITGYERYQVSSGGDSDYTPLEIARNHSEARSTQWSQELRLASNGASRFKWIAGLYYFKEDIKSDTASATLPDGSVPALPGDTAPNAFSRTRYDHSAESGAAFVNLGYDITDRFNLTVGGRFTRETKTLDFRRVSSPNAAATAWSSYPRWWDSYTGTFGGTGTFSGVLERTWDNFTYDVTPSWTVAPGHLLYFKFAHGVKSGGFNTAAQLPVALQVVEPEKLDAFEIGYKSSWFGGALTFNATAFHYQYDNVQINVVGPNPGAVGGVTTSYLQNAEEAHVNGAEFELTIVPHTLGETVMADYRAGRQVNLEVDLLARYLERLLLGDKAAEPKASGLTEGFLAENGYL